MTGTCVAACAVLGAALTGCGTATSGSAANSTVSTHTLSIYASQPPGAPTPASTDTLDAERLALSQAGAKAGSFAVRLVVTHRYELSANARAAAEDGSTIAYLGELAPGTSQIATEILNQLGILVVSPADTSAYLTEPVPGVSSTVTTFFPSHSTYKQTFARVVPNSVAEAKALVAAMGAAHVSSLQVSGDQTEYGRTLAAEVRQAARAASLTVTGSSGSSGSGGYFYAASASSPTARAAAVRAFDAAAAANPGLKLYAPSGLYDPAFVSGLSSAAQSRLFVSVPGILSADLGATGQTFVRDFTARFGHAPAPQAIFGYEAMAALLADLTKAGTKANQRSVVVTDFRSLSRTDSVLGAYSLSGGDPSIAPLLLARVRGGQLVPFRALSAAG